jgi:lysophospholipase L1-like esterase
MYWPNCLYRMNAKYLLGAALSLPLLPILYVHGQRIRASVPTLPEAAQPEGVSHTDAPEPPLTVLFLGESTMAGVGVATHQAGFAGAMADHLATGMGRSIHWRVYARSGYTARRLCEKMVPKITESHADLIAIALGGNDAFHLNTPWRWRADMAALVLALRERFPDTPIVFANMPPIKAFPALTPLTRFVVGNLVEILGETLAELCATLPNVHYYDRVITLEDWVTRLQIQAAPADFFSDGVHPSPLTYQTWGRDMAAYCLAVVQK